MPRTLDSTPSAPLAEQLAPVSSGVPLLDDYTLSSACSAEKLNSQAGLVGDVVRKAHGDPALTSSWLQELGAQEGNEKIDLDIAAADHGAPNLFFCPISHALMRDPVQLCTGQTFERASIEEWIKRGHSTCPCTGQNLDHPINLTPNYALRSCIESWAEANAVWLLVPDGHLKPLEDGDKMPTLRQEAPSHDRDLALAIRLQEEELSHAHAQRRAPAAHPQPHAPHRDRHRSRGRAHSRPRRRRTWPLQLMLYAMTIACLALTLVAFGLNSWQVENLHDNPLIGAGAPALRKLGCKATDKIVEPSNQWWRILSSAFIPSGVLALFAVVESLWTFALHLEAVVRGVPALTIGGLYLVGSIAGGLASANLATTRDSCGASAGVCTLLGAMWVEHFINRGMYRHRFLTFLLLVINTALFIILGFIPLSGDNFYQLVAMGCGAVLAPAILRIEAGDGRQARGSRRSRRQGPRRGCALRCAKLLGGVTVVALLALGIVGLAASHAREGDTCSWCQHFACIDTRWWQCAPQDVGGPTCVFTPHANNGTATVLCPSGESRTAPMSSQALPNSSTLIGMCRSFCGADTSSASAPQTSVIRAAPSGPSDDFQAQAPICCRQHLASHHRLLQPQRPHNLAAVMLNQRMATPAHSRGAGASAMLHG
ncbi:hypothetical protein WJX73_000731 [Symbiochloris irregularis]|uniref:RHOMBOID-like protein n=1 Tax=Symbiochloris irregularis TaxID=706552 RepID=A0AAW1P0Y4_9CHLO